MNDEAQSNVASHGFYSSGGRAWAQTRVLGTVCKARPDERVSPTAFERLRALYPKFFKGDRIAPDWA